MALFCAAKRAAQPVMRLGARPSSNHSRAITLPANAQAGMASGAGLLRQWLLNFKPPKGEPPLSTVSPGLPSFPGPPRGIYRIMISTLIAAENCTRPGPRTAAACSVYS